MVVEERVSRIEGIQEEFSNRLDNLNNRLIEVSQSIDSLGVSLCAGIREAIGSLRTANDSLRAEMQGSIRTLQVDMGSHLNTLTAGLRLVRWGR